MNQGRLSLSSLSTAKYHENCRIAVSNTFSSPETSAGPLTCVALRKTRRVCHKGRDKSNGFLKIRIENVIVVVVQPHQLSLMVWSWQRDSIKESWITPISKSDCDGGKSAQEIFCHENSRKKTALFSGFLGKLVAACRCFQPFACCLAFWHCSQSPCVFVRQRPRDIIRGQIP